MALSTDGLVSPEAFYKRYWTRMLAVGLVGVYLVIVAGVVTAGLFLRMF